jgi:hypothetical protein
MSDRNIPSKDVTGFEHDLKCAMEFFDVVNDGRKPFEIRKGDRPFKVGDTLLLREVDLVLAYTGRETRKRITYCLRGWGMESGYVALGLAPLHVETPRDAGAALKRIVDAYDVYRGRGVSPAPNEYQGLVDAINAARPALKTSARLVECPACYGQGCEPHLMDDGRQVRGPACERCGGSGRLAEPKETRRERLREAAADLGVLPTELPDTRGEKHG